MRRWMPGIMVAGVLATTATGCADTGPLEVTYEVSGADGTATLTRTYPERSESGDTTVTRTVQEEGVAVPYTRTLVVDRGRTTLTAGPGTSAFTCRIVVEGREVAKAEGGPGKDVTCRADIDE